jgi:hypothetical protein
VATRACSVTYRMFEASGTLLKSARTATVLDVEVRALSTKHSIALEHVERWLADAIGNPSEASKKAKLKMILVQT